mgnify:CR=1 FL=1
MKNKKKTVTIIAIIGIGLAIIGGIGFYTCYHTWNAATCTRPRTCSICGKTEGESKGHTWSNATCTKPQTFQRQYVHSLLIQILYFSHM